MIKIATVCSGIGAPEFGLHELAKEQGFEVENVFACEIDKYARASYLANHKPNVMYEDMTSEYFHENAGYSDLFIGGIPCQAFSLAGKRLGELDKRGLLFYDFYRYVKEKQPKVFIIENVKGLLSDAGGKTFQNWLLLLGNSVNSHSQMFNHPDSLGYNLHHTVLNSKNFGVPQNRERVFIVGIRNDLPNNFRFPIGWKLEKRLKDVLETNVDEKYYLSDTCINRLTENKEGFHSEIRTGESIASTILASDYKLAMGMNVLRVKEATKQGYAIAEPGDSINLSNPNSETRRGRVGVQIANTLDTACNQAVVEPQLTQVAQLDGYESEGRIYDGNGLARTIKDGGGGGAKTGWYEIVEPVQLGKSKQFAETSQQIGTDTQPAFCIRASQSNGIRENKSRIRRLTPLECWRLQCFSDESYYNAKDNANIDGKIGMSDTQLYKQAGNSMTKTVIEAIIDNLIQVL